MIFNAVSQAEEFNYGFKLNAEKCFMNENKIIIFYCNRCKDAQKRGIFEVF